MNSHSEDEDSDSSLSSGNAKTNNANDGNLRSSLKIIRDPTKTAFDHLPTGETLGAFANRHAVDRYARKVKSKRDRARETRLKKRKLDKSKNSSKETYGTITRPDFSRKIAA